MRISDWSSDVFSSDLPLFVKGVLPILRNTASGLAAVDPRMVEAGRGMGMTPSQILFRVEVPAAIPVVISGLRISAVMLVSVLPLTAYFGVERLGPDRKSDVLGKGVSVCVNWGV